MFKKFLAISLLILMASPALLDLFRPGMFISHDGQDHVARIANLYQSLSEGNLIPRWAANLNWGYGHPILMFLYPLPSYFASLFHFLGFSFVDSVKLVFAITFILSGITMYLWISEFLGRKAGFVAGIFYMFAPYRFVDLYVRGAIGEHVFFIFPPLVLFFLFKLSQKSQWGYIVGGALSLAGLILSHNALSLMFLPVIFTYSLFLFWQTKINRKLFIIHYSLFVILGLALSAFFWMPAFFEGKYTLRDIVTAGDYSTRFTPLGNLIYSSWSYGIAGEFSTQIGVIQWLIVASSIGLIFYLFKRKTPYWIFALGLLVFFFLSIFLMIPPSFPIWQNLTILQKFQFPWRFLSLAIFPPAVLVGIVVYFLPSKIKWMGMIVFLAAVIFANRNYWHARGFFEKPESFYTGIYEGTTDTGESSPRWSVRFMEKRPSEPLQVIEGEAVVEQKKRLSNAHLYEVDVRTRTRFAENTLYFPGWEIMVDNNKVAVEFQDPDWRGLQTFYVEPGKHWILVHFTETKLRSLANIISLLTLLALLLFSRFPLTNFLLIFGFSFTQLY